MDMSLLNNNRYTLPRKLFRATNRFRRKINNYLTSVTDEYIKQEIEIQNPIIKKIALTSTINFRMNYSKYLLNYESEVDYFSGKSKISEKQFNTLYIGDGVSKEYFIQSFYKVGEIQKVSKGKILFSSITKTIDPEKLNVDLIIFERNMCNNWIPPYGEWIRTPRWVRMVYQRFSNGDAEKFTHQF